MNTAPRAKVSPSRSGGLSWGLWAERAVIRALEIDPNAHVAAGLLAGQRVAHVALTIARAVGYLAGTQRAPELPAQIRAWLDDVAMVEGSTKGARLGGLSWREWARRASVIAMEMDRSVSIEGTMLQGQPMRSVVFTIAVAVGYLTGEKKTWALPPELYDWLQGPQHRMNETTTLDARRMSDDP